MTPDHLYALVGSDLWSSVIWILACSVRFRLGGRNYGGQK